ncbi:rhodanese-like domain-containing protein [Paraglaciecola sp. 25GB23A]|uniref:rhodanese-like domain-containing protein n=1 Tax=Paraglaciecola sp. 25GB23A TaxID=3156068 RepID=UPI0032AF5FDD
MHHPVTAISAAEPQEALAHFTQTFEFETDCWDTHEGLRIDPSQFVLLDVRSKALFDKGHIPGAISLPHSKIIESKLRQWPKDILFVTYCAGPHCNGAARGAVRLATLGRKVKLMAGGITGWIDEGFELEISK